jgi:hypothetical protein
MSDPARHDAPHQPETLGTVLHAAASLPPDALDRIHALEDGRHPSLDDLRAALGSSFDLDIAIKAGVAALAGGSADHAPIAAALDAAYRALSAPKLVRAEITASSIFCWRDPAPIALVEEEPLLLVVLADNRTDATVEFSAESHGEGFGGFVEAQRTGSSLLNLGPMPAGKYLVPLLVVAGGRAHTIDLPIECANRR